MQNEGKTDNRKTMIVFSFADFRAPSKSRMFIFRRFHKFTTQLYTRAIPWINLNSVVTSLHKVGTRTDKIISIISSYSYHS